MDSWVTDKQTDGFELHWRVKSWLHRERTEYQDLAVVELDDFGHALLLDDVVQTTEGDEFIYHEMLAHVALCAHPQPRRVLVIGGGDGGTVREVLKHGAVQQADLVEIDRRVVEVCRLYLPHHTSGLNDPRTRIYYRDGVQHVAEKQGAYDVILIDAPDPVGPAGKLFRPEFHRMIQRALTDDGIVALQSQSPIFDRDLIRSIQKELAVIFRHAALYLAVVPTYPGGWWSFAIGSKRHPVDRPARILPKTANLQYYSDAVHRASFVLPPYMERLMPDSKEKQTAIS